MSKKLKELKLQAIELNKQIETEEKRLKREDTIKSFKWAIEQDFKVRFIKTLPNNEELDIDDIGDLIATHPEEYATFQDDIINEYIVEEATRKADKQKRS